MTSNRQDVQLVTRDGVRLVGHWYPVDAPKGWALLLHMMPATKESYGTLAAALREQGIASLAIDFRGHGASQGGPAGYEQFTDTEQQAKREDVAAALAWLAMQGMVESKAVLVGSSIGANLALEALAERSAIPAAVLLSPGFEYRGIATEPLAARVASTQRVFLAAGGAEDASSTDTVRALASILGDRATVRTFPNAGHGTTMFERESTLVNDVVQWVLQRLE